MGRKRQDKLLQFADDLMAHAVAVLQERGLAENLAAEAAGEITKRICSAYARSTMYVPINIRAQLDLRDKLIWQQYGTPGPDGVRAYTQQRLEQLVEAHQLTLVQLYAITKLQQQIEVDGRQGKLPGLEAPEGVS